MAPTRSFTINICTHITKSGRRDTQRTFLVNAAWLYSSESAESPAPSTRSVLDSHGPFW